MSDVPAKRKDWEKSQEVMQKKSLQQLPFDAGRPAEAPAGAPVGVDAMGKPDGIIASYQAGKVQRAAVVEFLKTWYGQQLEVAKHQLSEVARVRKAEATLVAEQFIRDLDHRHLQFLTTLGLRNLEMRNKALLDLGDQTSRTLAELEQRDWPISLVEQTIAGVIDLHTRFFAKITQELGEQ